MTDASVTSVVLAGAAQLLQFQIRVSVKCFILSFFIVFFQINHKHISSELMTMTAFLDPHIHKM